MPAYPHWSYPAFAGGVLVFVTAAWISPPLAYPHVRVAFMGNSMQYYNDLPRFMEALSDYHVHQNSCLHGDSNLVNLLETGNGMYKKWTTDKALVESQGSNVLYDYGACTVHQLLFGYDDELEASLVDDDQTYSYAGNGNLYNDGTNPCFESEGYFDYLEEGVYGNRTVTWDFVLLNDNTRSPARNSSRQASLEKLDSLYVEWFQMTGVTPVFLVTHAYWTDWRNLTGLVDVPTFTSLTHEGYRQYAELLADQLPASQRPRLAPVGIAFLTVYEENYSMWLKLFHIDEVHASPHGTFLQGCVVHYTIFGRMPKSSVAMREDMKQLWSRARRMQPPSHRSNPIPTKEEATYLFHVADRVMRQGYVPKSFTFYKNGEYAPDVDEER